MREKKPVKKKVASPKSFKAYMMRTCSSDMTSYGGFKWPSSGEVIAHDWKNTTECGNGLHGLLWGEGDGSLLNWSEDAKWLVCGIDSWVELYGKVKSEKATVIYAGTRQEATLLIGQLGGGKYTVCGGTATAGDYGTATAGYSGTATAGYRGTATAGDGGTATAGDGGIILVKWWDGCRYRITTGYCGENGIEPNKRYRCDNQGNLIEVA